MNNQFKEWIRNGCKTSISEKGLYSHSCVACGRNEKDHNKLYETGYYTREIKIVCKCGSIYSYTA